METFPEDMCETVKARIVCGGERQVMGVWGGGEQRGWWRLRNSCF